MIVYYYWHKTWSHVSQHASATCRQKKSASNRESNATLTLNLAALIVSNNEDDLFYNVHIDTSSYSIADVQTNFDVNDDHIIN